MMGMAIRLSKRLDVTMSHRILRGLLWLSLLLCTSRVDFDGQKCSYRYDAASDELRIFQVYERIYASSQKGKLHETEQKQFAAFMEEKELCGYQTVTVSNVSALLDIANQAQTSQ